MISHPEESRPLTVKEPSRNSLFAPSLLLTAPSSLSCPGFVDQLESSVGRGWRPELGLALYSWCYLENQAGLCRIVYTGVTCGIVSGYVRRMLSALDPHHLPLVCYSTPTVSDRRLRPQRERVCPPNQVLEAAGVSVRPLPVKVEIFVCSL